MAALPRIGPVIGRRDGQPGHLRAHNVSHLANGHLHDLGIAHTLHCLRHRFATVVYRRSRDIVLTAELLGHSSMNTTRGYAAFDRSRTVDVVGGIGLPIAA